MTEPRESTELLMCPTCLALDVAVAGTCRAEHSETEMIPVMPVSEHEAAMEAFRAACRHTVMHCSCQPSGQTCDRCHPAMVALARGPKDWPKVRSTPTVDAEVVGALRLAFEAGSSDQAKAEIAERLLSYAPPTVPTALGPTRLLLRAVKESRVNLVVNGSAAGPA